MAADIAKHVLIIRVIILTIIFVTAFGSEDKDAFVVFDDRVSVLDQWHRATKTVSDLAPLVNKVATEFTRVVVRVEANVVNGVLSINNYTDNEMVFYPFAVSKATSPSQIFAASAFAQYNRKRPSHSPKIEVWLVCTYLKDLSNTNYLPSLANLLEEIATKANQISEGTVTTIFLPHGTFDHHTNNECFLQVGKCFKYLSSKFQWGVFISASSCKTRGDALVSAFQLNVLLVEMFSLGQHLDSSYPSSYQCTPFIGPNQTANFAYMVSIPDTHGESNTSMTRLVNTWNSWRHFAKSSNITVVINGAFDTPLDTEPYKTRGWWRLIENPMYSSTADYIFEEKSKIASKFDKDIKSINRSLLNGQVFRAARNNLGIIFRLFGTTTSVTGDIAWYLLKILKLVSAEYSKVIVLADALYSSDFYKDMRTVSVVSDLEEKVEVFLVLSDPDWEANDIKKHRNDHLPGIRMISACVQAFVFDNVHRENNTKFIKNSLKSDGVTNYKFGFLYDISICLSFDTLPEDNQTSIITSLRQSNLSIFVFGELSDSVSLGAERLFQQRVVLLEFCKRKIKQIQISENIRPQVEIGFLLLDYKHPLDIYYNELALYNWVIYWDKLRKWAKETETLVIMSNTVDNTRTADSDFTDVQLGWWKPEFKKDPASGISKIEWIDKRTTLLRLVGSSEKKQQQQQQDSTFWSTFGIVGILVTAVIVAVTVFFITRKYYDKNFLSSEEVKEFFDGNQNSKSGTDLLNHQVLPYDKSKFELQPDSFSFDESRILGSGEFGKVCEGKVESVEGVSQDVAVKMPNDKFNRNAVLGLLSEIKVLAHVGKHENVIELIGAFTAELGKGKVYVFLELGKLGSLDKHLRNLGPAINEENGDEGGMEMSVSSAYANDATANFLAQDPSLSQDLNRWSYEICNGMSFLASKHVVHADLATRNVLLDLNKTAKICDFGLSRRMYNYSNYMKKGQDPIPWKWMPPESLKRMEFDEKSDVWAYGVTLWEIYSLGDTPYPGLSWDVNFPRILEQGFRMSKPVYADRGMYDVIMDCWKCNPSNRPTFPELLDRLSTG